MKFTINTKEFKNVMKLVHTVADCAASARVVTHNVCLLRALPDEKRLKLEFSLNGSSLFLTYTFENVEIEGDFGESKEFKRSVDLGSIASLDFSGSTISIALGTSQEGNTLEFQSGLLKGKLLLSHPDVEKDVDNARPESDAVPLKQQFLVTDFLTALSAHNYGTHHNAQEAAKRPVRIYSKKNAEDVTEILFISRDKIAAASFVVSTESPIEEDFNFYILPKPLIAVLKTLPLEYSPVFQFGLSRDFWRLSHGQFEVYFPNIIQEVDFDLEELTNVVNTYPSFTIETTPKMLSKALTAVAPFTSSSLFFAKNDMPIVRLIVENGVGYFTLNTSKAKDVEIEIENIEFTCKDQTYDPTDMLLLNFKYLSEAVAHLAGVEDKTKKTKEKDKEKDKEKEAIYLKWWPYQDLSAPTKGKTLCLNCGNNYYWISRVRDVQRNV